MLMGSYMNWDSVISIARASELLGGLVSVCWVHKQLSSVGDLLRRIGFWAENYLHIISLKVSEFMNINDYAPVVSLKAKVDVDVFDS